ncbi:MAG TPA: hypothetical protein VHH36_07460, partial [Candidatus Thermoplasmatota archaeon]|nr:hypothetical protein [Candidatus Thermoplasmatota archaeon]
MRASALLLAALLAATLVPVPAAAADATLRWSYRLSLPDPGSGNVRVELAIDGAKDVVAKFDFLVDGRAAVTNLTGGPSTPLATREDGFAFDVDGPESFRYDVRVEQVSFRGDERLAHAGTDFALFKAETLQLAFTYSYYEGSTWRNETTVEVAPPPGWTAQTPWARGADGRFVLGDEVLPRGYVAMGDFKEVREFDAGGKRVRYARLGDPGAFEARMESYMANATPYYEGVYGPGVGDVVLVVNAPAPMFHGGLGGVDSLFLHEDVDLKTLSHEYAHVFQRWASREEAPGSTIWVNEGDADYHGAFALYATGEWTAAQVNEFFREARADERDPKLARAVLADAAYGSDLEKFAYRKGALVLHEIDARVRAATDGARGLPEVLRALNAELGDRARELTNEDVARVLAEVAGEDLSDVLSSYVLGTAWPPERVFVPEGRLVVASLALDPPQAAPGARVDATVVVANAGTAPLSAPLTLRAAWGDETRHVNLSVGESGNVTFPLVAPLAPGAYELIALGENATLRVLRPADVRLTRVELPERAFAGVAARVAVALANVGELPGRANVAVSLDGEVVAEE